MSSDSIPHSKTTLGEEDFHSIAKTLKSGIIIADNTNLQFRIKLSKYLKKEYVLLYSSGSMALYNILLALNPNRKNEILLPTYVCLSVYKSVRLAGYTPVLYDNAKDSWISSYDQIVNKITRKTKAVIVVHTFGIRMDEIKRLNDHGIYVIEDCAHALTSDIDGKAISTHSLCSFYSFNSTKLLATGEGGAVATDDFAFSEKLRENQLDKGLADLNCALGLSQLSKIEGFLDRRREIAQEYFKRLGRIAKDLRKYDSIHFRFPIFVRDDSAFLKSKVMYKKGVDALLHYMYENHTRNYHNAEEVFKKTISIPIYPSLKEEEVKIICEETQRLYYSA